MIFADIDFSKPPYDQIDFSGFEFGWGANFSGCKWRGRNLEHDSDAFAPGRAFFTGADFGDMADFTGAVFGAGANFTGAAFDFMPDFTGAAFGWGARATFTGTTFGRGALFANATFGDAASFVGAAFGNFSSFNGAIFRLVEFTGTSEKQWIRHLADALGMDKEAHAELKRRHRKLWETNGSRSDRFLTISFANARFDGEAYFSGRSFEGTADFTDARFCSPPDFDGAANVAHIDFTGVNISFVPAGKLLHWTKNGRIPVRLRAFRKIAEETKNHDLERDLYKEERKAERGVYLHLLREDMKKAREKGLEELKKKLGDIDNEQEGSLQKWRHKAAARVIHKLGIANKIRRLVAHGFWIVIMFLYWALADYGRSFVRPALCLVTSGFAFYWLYLWILAPMMAKAGPLDMHKYEHAVRMLALGNTVPFLGPLTIDAEIKKFLFCRGFPECSALPPQWFQLAVLGQNLLSIILVFFIGLALRNYFKIK